jgi:hypothetical protein
MDAQTERSRFWPLTLRSILILVPTILLAAYVVSYFWISRARWSEYRQFNAAGFYYLPWSKLDRPDRPGWKTHATLEFVYAPLNWIDAHLLGGPHVASPPLFKIGPP